MASEDKVSITCDFCGITIWGDNEDELVKNCRRHALEQHAIDVSDEETRQKIRESMVATSGRVVH